MVLLSQVPDTDAADADHRDLHSVHYRKKEQADDENDSSQLRAQAADVERVFLGGECYYAGAVR